MTHIIRILTGIIISVSSLSAQSYQDRLEQIDILEYQLHLEVNDTTNIIQGRNVISLSFKQPVASFTLDLVGLDEEGEGMQVDRVLENGEEVSFIHQEDQLTISIDNADPDDIQTFEVFYYGIPKDGLIIGENKYGDRTFFGDNWPNRAKNWFPCVDHPSDKALVEFVITAPDHYQVIGNGEPIEETNLSDEVKLYRWKTKVPLPTKVMVIGIARFATDYVGEFYDIPVYSWVYPQNREEGFYDYEIGGSVMEYFVTHVGPYPFSKLANVQSKTIFGGMENAGNIFYFEGSVNGNRTIEDLFAHEIAHQWFGNSASEKDWPHLWLSEGFATYMTNLYVEHHRGRADFLDKITAQRNQVISFANRRLTPVVDTSVTDYMKLLNANSYQKGGWVLHMLRKKLGDELFWEGIRAYYRTYQYRNADTRDFQLIIEQVAGVELDTFVNQWLYQPGHPVLGMNWLQENEAVVLEIRQKQSGTVFHFPMDFEMVYEDGSSEIKTFSVNEKEKTFRIPVDKKVASIIPDPNVWLLYEGEMVARN